MAAGGLERVVHAAGPLGWRCSITRDGRTWTAAAGATPAQAEIMCRQLIADSVGHGPARSVQEAQIARLQAQPAVRVRIGALAPRPPHVRSLCRCGRTA